MFSLVIFLSLLGVSFCQSLSPQLIFNWNRHGVRYLRDSFGSESGAQLLPSAYDRLYTKGQNLRHLYPNLLSSAYNPNEIYVNSSGWQRTISTAYGILAGIYGNNDTRQIPVFSTPWYQDYTIYNYQTGMCPKYDVDWKQFQTTPEWSQKVQKYSNLTQYLNGLINPSTPITLSQIFTIWDGYWIQRNRPEAGILYPNIDDFTYNILTEAANWVETQKYSSRISGSYFGSTSLLAIKYRMDMFKNGNKMFSHKWNSASGHYGTQLNILAALGYDGQVSKTIPDYNSVLTFELLNMTNSKWGIRIVYHDGIWVSNSSLTIIKLKEFCDSTANDCIIDYDSFWQTYKTKDLKQWCSDCGNTMELCGTITITNTVTVMDKNNTNESIEIAILAIVSLNLLIVILAHFPRRVNLACGATQNRHTELSQL